MRSIDITTLDRNLLADLDGDIDGYLAYEADYPKATVSNDCYHIVYNEDTGRGGIVYVGSGSDGLTYWTDAKTPEEVVARFERDEMLG